MIMPFICINSQFWVIRKIVSTNFVVADRLSLQIGIIFQYYGYVIYYFILVFHFARSGQKNPRKY
jgi:hypothetical protein